MIKIFFFIFGVLLISFLIGFILINWNFTNLVKSIDNPYIQNRFLENENENESEKIEGSQDEKKFLTPPLVIAHRGGAQLAPENSLVAFNKADGLGVDILEMDVHLTKNNFLVVHHDKTIDRTSDGSGFISNYTYEELQAFNFGYHFQSMKNNESNESHQKQESFYPYREEGKEVRISKLEDVFRVFPLKRMIIEIKDQGMRGEQAALKLLNLLKKYDKTRQVVMGSFHDDIIEFIHDQMEEGFLGAAPRESLKFILAASIRMNLFKLEAQLLILPLQVGPIDLTQSHILETAHRRNLAVYYWTINEEEVMKKLLGMGVDGILTDRPDLLIELINRPTD